MVYRSTLFGLPISGDTYMQLRFCMNFFRNVFHVWILSSSKFRGEKKKSKSLASKFPSRIYRCVNHWKYRMRYVISLKHERSKCPWNFKPFEDKKKKQKKNSLCVAWSSVLDLNRISVRFVNFFYLFQKFRLSFAVIYTRVSNYLPWIQKKLNGQCLCKPQIGERINFMKNNLGCIIVEVN